MLIVFVIKKFDRAKDFYCQLRYVALLSKAWAKNVWTIQVDADDCYWLRLWVNITI